MLIDSELLLSPSDAARLVPGRDGQPITPDALKRYDNRLQPIRLRDGTRLYRRDVIERFAEVRRVDR